MNYITVQHKMLKRILGIAALLGTVALAGCATADKNVRLDYQPTVNAVGGSGELYVAISAERDPLAKRSDVEWIVGLIKDDDGKPLGKILTNMEPKGLVADAFIQTEYRRLQGQSGAVTPTRCCKRSRFFRSHA